MSRIIESLYTVSGVTLNNKAVINETKSINESTTPMKAMELAVSLLNFLSKGENFNRLLHCSPVTDKSGKTRNYCDYVFHHISNSHNNNEINNIAIINRNDHNLYHKGKKSLDECDIIYFSDYLGQFFQTIEAQAIKDEDESLNNK